MEGEAVNHWRAWDLSWGVWVLHPAVFLSHRGGRCRMTVVSWGPEGEVEVSARGEMCGWTIWRG